MGVGWLVVEATPNLLDSVKACSRHYGQLFPGTLLKNTPWQVNAYESMMKIEEVATVTAGP